ncbi:MAG TPA: hypothetical protein VJ746_04965 [Nitrospira sp.]|nr:hypothetical protein [Nitrospira sp.]
MSFGFTVSAFLVMFWLGGVPLSQADEPLSIRTLLGAASSFQAHAVTVMGVVKNIEIVHSFYRNCNSYSFTLEDESGSIGVEVAGTCYRAAARTAISDGQKVVVRGLFIAHSSGGIDTPFIFANTFAVKEIPD